MTKEEKLVVIDSLAEQFNEYPHFYITNIEALNAEQTASLRRKCFESDIKLVVVKNTLLAKALERVEKADADLVKFQGRRYSPDERNGKLFALLFLRPVVYFAAGRFAFARAGQSLPGS